MDFKPCSSYETPTYFNLDFTYSGYIVHTCDHTPIACHI